MIQLSELIHLIATDEKLREELAVDPKNALREHNLQVSRETLQALQSIHHLLVYSSQSLCAVLHSQMAKDGADWGRHLNPSLGTYEATKTTK